MMKAVVFVCVLALLVSVQAAETEDKGFLSGILGGSNTRSQFTGAANRISPIDTKCALCQYFVQRIQNDIVEYSSPGVYAEVDESVKAYDTPKYSFLEVSESVEETGGPSISEINAVNANPPMNVGSIPSGVMPGRYRHSDMLGARPFTARWDPMRLTGPSMEQEQARAQYKAMYNVVFQKLQALCQSRIPQPFLPYCASVMKDYPQIAEGLHYNDRPDVVCMNLNYCGELSYAYNAPHARYVDERTQSDAIPAESRRPAL